MHLTPRASASSGWLPAALLGLAAVVILTAYGTPIQATVLFATYLILGVTVPGTLWVRFLRGGPRHIAEDLALGLLVGYAVEIATYLVARAIDAPYLFLVCPIATITGFLAVPRLRVSDRTVPSWDQPLLAANDRVFSAPSVDAVAAIRGGYGVRWLFADLSATDGDALGRVAYLRYRVGNYAVFEVRPAA